MGAGDPVQVSPWVIHWSGSGAGDPVQVSHVGADRGTVSGVSLVFLPIICKNAPCKKFRVFAPTIYSSDTILSRDRRP